MSRVSAGEVLGYVVARPLDGHDELVVEPYETDDDGHLVVHPTPLEALAARAQAGGDPDTWPVIELRVIPDRSIR